MPSDGFSFMQSLDLHFATNEYICKSGITYKLRKTRRTDAELLLQQMFDEDAGPNLMDDDEELDAVYIRDNWSIQ